MSDELVRWLREQLDEDERIAKAAASVAPVLGAENWRSREGMPEEGFRYWCITTTPPDHTVTTVELAGSGRSGGGVHEEAVAQHIAAHDPARVLREIDVKRRVLEIHRVIGGWEDEDGQDIGLGCNECGHSAEYSDRGGWCDTVRLLALPYADRPGYREEWRP